MSVVFHCNSLIVLFVVPHYHNLSDNKNAATPTSTLTQNQQSYIGNVKHQLRNALASIRQAIFPFQVCAVVAHVTVMSATRWNCAVTGYHYPICICEKHIFAIYLIYTITEFWWSLENYRSDQFYMSQVVV